ncbi:hypothetical protein JDN40_16685 [Rhodomicrobium vannielii ATCC 17100]|uniref:hypothetical protein n=1 Tax=Rhodomicrobium vannielii TaxID=1069 RepID=UPI00191B62FF|nr:hypothetical protein [Rhodomicrobium vannielii]MBJ7535745.1 hypothetical protein [Rhodomicrobium vannielii ATCC 17100]
MLASLVTGRASRNPRGVFCTAAYVSNRIFLFLCVAAVTLTLSAFVAWVPASGERWGIVMSDLPFGAYAKNTHWKMH